MAFVLVCFLVWGWNGAVLVEWDGLGWSVLEYKGVVGSKRRIGIPRVYVLAYGLGEGSVVGVRLYDRENYGEAEFLARVQGASGSRSQRSSVGTLGWGGGACWRFGWRR